MQPDLGKIVLWPFIVVTVAVLLAIVAAFRAPRTRQTAWPLVLLGGLGLFALFGIYFVRSSHVAAPSQSVGPVALQIYQDGSPVPHMAPMPSMAPSGLRMPNGTMFNPGGMSRVEIGHPFENQASLVPDPSAWRPEVEELYRANLYSSAATAARSLGQRLRQQLAKLAQSERPKRVYVVSPEGPADVGTTATVQLVASEIARQLRQLDQLDVQLVDSAQSVREEWAAASAAMSAASAVPADSIAPTEPAPIAAEIPASPAEVPTPESSSASDEAWEGSETPVSPAPPAPEGAPLSSSVASDAQIEAVVAAETPAEESVAAGAEIVRPADVASLDSSPSDTANSDTANSDTANSVGGRNDGVDSSATSPSDVAAPRVPYLVEIDLVDYSVQKPGNWGMDSTSQGTLRVSLESPVTLFDQEVRFYDKPWVDREDEVAARFPRGSFVVVRSELMVSPEEARQQNQRLLGEYMYYRLLSANQLNPETLQPNQLIESDALQSLIQDRFVQQLEGPAGEPMWREATLVRPSVPGEPDALTQWVQQRQVEQLQVRQFEQVRRRSVGAQMVVILGGIAGLYTLLNAATQGYFTGRLRAVAVVAIVLALLGFFMIS